MTKNVTMLVTLNSIKYKKNDLEFLHDSNYSWVEIQNNQEHWPSAIGWDAIMIAVTCVGSPLLEGMLNELGADLYKWFKEKLSQVVRDKEDFDESRILIKFNDFDVTIYFNKKEDLIFVFENLNKIIEHHRIINPSAKELSISIYDGNRTTYGETY
jgi:hypothetical protein